MLQQRRECSRAVAENNSEAVNQLTSYQSDLLRLAMADPPHVYTFDEYADMHLCYGASNSNALEARRLYAERYPNRVLPSVPTILAVDRRARSTGSLAVSWFRLHTTGDNVVD